MYLLDIFTASVNLAGLPGLSLPCGVNRQGLPLGMQILGRPFEEGTVLRAAYAYESRTGGGRRRKTGRAPDLRTC
jgi:aspartyl-tRNA(Asn)/glutamyl-tRNA(Gln) amidotransferase subunit A